VTLTLTNLDAAAMPAGIGLHPYFGRPDGFWLKAGVSGRWATEPGEPGLPLRREAAPEDLSAAGLDHCFYGWDGVAEFGGREGLQLTLTGSGAFGNLVIYTPPGKPYVCAEPVSHVNNAINMSGLAPSESMALLAPAEALSGTMTLSARLTG
jgi:aldose 1-epimerase